MNINDLLNRLETAEEAFLQTEFLAPVLPGRQVRLRIAGVVCSLRVTGKAEPGWAILKPQDHNRAKVIERPGPAQVREYLSLFPAVHLLLVARPADTDRMATEAKTWLAIPAHRGDQRFKIQGPVRVHLATGVRPFQRVVARFDGTLFWFEEIDRRRSPAVAAYLRRALDKGIKPKDVRKRTLTAEEREAYRLAYKASEAARLSKAEVRLSEALAHAGAGFVSFVERDDAYAVTFAVDGREYRSTVRQKDLAVLTAGICLDGRDRHFDLQSLVGVIREGQEGQRLVGVGPGRRLDEDAYWRIHPPED